MGVVKKERMETDAALLKCMNDIDIHLIDYVQVVKLGRDRLKSESTETTLPNVANAVPQPTKSDDELIHAIFPAR